MKNLYFYILVLTVSLTAQSCFNYVNLIDAEAHGKGAHSIMIEGEGNVVVSPGDGIGGWASAEALYTRGMTDDYDLGFYVNSNRMIGLHNKYQLINKEQTDFSVGIDIKYLLFSPVFEFSPTLYYSHQIGKTRILANPSLRIATGYNAEGVLLSPNITIGAQFGEKPFRLGYNLGSNPYGPIGEGAVHTVGLVYVFHL